MFISVHTEQARNLGVYRLAYVKYALYIHLLFEQKLQTISHRWINLKYQPRFAWFNRPPWLRSDFYVWFPGCTLCHRFCESVPAISLVPIQQERYFASCCWIWIQQQDIYNVSTSHIHITPWHDFSSMFSTRSKILINCFFHTISQLCGKSAFFLNNLLCKLAT